VNQPGHIIDRVADTYRSEHVLLPGMDTLLRGFTDHDRQIAIRAVQAVCLVLGRAAAVDAWSVQRDDGDASLTLRAHLAAATDANAVRSLDFEHLATVYAILTPAYVNRLWVGTCSPVPGERRLYIGITLPLSLHWQPFTLTVSDMLMFSVEAAFRGAQSLDADATVTAVAPPPAVADADYPPVMAQINSVDRELCTHAINTLRRCKGEAQSALFGEWAVQSADDRIVVCGTAASADVCFEYADLHRVKYSNPLQVWRVWVSLDPINVHLRMSCCLLRVARQSVAAVHRSTVAIVDMDIVGAVVGVGGGGDGWGGKRSRNNM